MDDKKKLVLTIKKLTNIEIKSTLMQNQRYKISLQNKELNLTEKIIANNIQFSDLKFKIIIIHMQKLSDIIKAKYLQPEYPNQKEEIQYKDYTPKDFDLELNDLSDEMVFKVSCKLIEKTKDNKEKEWLLSNNVIYSPKKGEINIKVITKLYNDKYKPNRFFCQSEKDNIKSITNEMMMRDMDDLLNKEDIKEFTYENRTYDNIKQFVDSKYKASKLMTDKRKKKVLFSTHSELYFSNKMQINDKKNPFMKNEWFMGPIYSYDNNYDKLI